MTEGVSRRLALKSLGATVALAAGVAPFTVLGAKKPRVVVVGGGAGGATVARYVAKSGQVDVTLVEANEHYTTCFFSNLYLGGFRSLESITHSYDKLAAAVGVRVVTDIATAVDADKRIVRLMSGGALAYDRLVLAPGIDFKYEAIEGYGPAAEQVMPHAYRAGAQSALLRRQIVDMKDGGLVVIVPPPNPFRCPPGPYERASMIAHYLKYHKPKSKILILDSKDKHSKQALFQEAWERFYPGMIEWLPGELTGGVKAVDVTNMAVVTEDETHRADVVNVIPPQQAGWIARSAGAAAQSGWCPVQAHNLASKLLPDVHVVGDSIIPGDMPKSAFAANSQAKVCANAIVADLADKQAFRPRFRNTCWSLVATGHGIKVGASYEATEEKIAKTSGFISQTGEDDTTRAATANEANGWYAGITADLFG
ncbi:MAG: NAD(P)/FAD-dependent oxidoreductase [Gammaproteobacteria bacterium]|nr:NAD(P)/FAD-dependent oxidoreductase [Gammaproteobacteria bacterium]